MMTAPDRTPQTGPTWGLILDVFDVLDRHSYTQSSDNGDLGAAMLHLYRMVRAYEGTGVVS